MAVAPPTPCPAGEQVSVRLPHVGALPAHGRDDRGRRASTIALAVPTTACSARSPARRWRSRCASARGHPALQRRALVPTRAAPSVLASRRRRPPSASSAASGRASRPSSRSASCSSTSRASTAGETTTLNMSGGGVLVKDPWRPAARHRRPRSRSTLEADADARPRARPRRPRRRPPSRRACASTTSTPRGRRAPDALRPRARAGRAADRRGADERRRRKKAKKGKAPKAERPPTRSSGSARTRAPRARSAAPARRGRPARLRGRARPAALRAGVPAFDAAARALIAGVAVPPRRLVPSRSLVWRQLMRRRAARPPRRHRSAAASADAGRRARWPPRRPRDAERDRARSGRRDATVAPVDRVLLTPVERERRARAPRARAASAAQPPAPPPTTAASGADCRRPRLDVRALARRSFLKSSPAAADHSTCKKE